MADLDLSEVVKRAVAEALSEDRGVKRAVAEALAEDRRYTGLRGEVEAIRTDVTSNSDSLDDIRDSLERMHHRLFDSSERPSLTQEMAVIKKDLCRIKDGQIKVKKAATDAVEASAPSKSDLAKALGGWLAAVAAAAWAALSQK